MKLQKSVLCDKLVALLSEYFEGVTRPACRDLQRHIAKCAPCRGFVESLRQVIVAPERNRPKKPSPRVVAHMRKAVLMPARKAKRSLRASTRR